MGTWEGWRRVGVAGAALAVPLLAGVVMPVPATTGVVPPGDSAHSGVPCDQQDLPDEVCEPWSEGVQGTCPDRATAVVGACHAALAPGPATYEDGRCCWDVLDWGKRFRGEDCGCATCSSR